MSHCAFIPGPTICKLNGGFKCVSRKKTKPWEMIQFFTRHREIYFSDGVVQPPTYKDETALSTLQFDAPQLLGSGWEVLCFVFFFSGNVGITRGVFC